MPPALRAVGLISSIWGGINTAYCIYRLIVVILIIVDLARIDVARQPRELDFVRGCMITFGVFYFILGVLSFLAMSGGIAVLRRRNAWLAFVTHVPGVIAAIGFAACVTTLAFERLGGPALTFMLGYAMAFILGLAVCVFNIYVLNQSKYRRRLDR